MTGENTKELDDFEDLTESCRSDKDSEELGIKERCLANFEKGNGIGNACFATLIQEHVGLKEYQRTLVDKNDVAVINGDMLMLFYPLYLQNNQDGNERALQPYSFLNYFKGVSERCQNVKTILIPLSFETCFLVFFQKKQRQHFVFLLIHTTKAGVDVRIIDSAGNTFFRPDDRIKKWVVENGASIKTIFNINEMIRVDFYHHHMAVQPILRDKKCALYVIEGMMALFSAADDLSDLKKMLPLIKAGQERVRTTPLRKLMDDLFSKKEVSHLMSSSFSFFDLGVCRGDVVIEDSFKPSS